MGSEECYYKSSKQVFNDISHIQIPNCTRCRQILKIPSPPETKNSLGSNRYQQPPTLNISNYPNNTVYQMIISPAHPPSSPKNLPQIWVNGN